EPIKIGQWAAAAWSERYSALRPSLGEDAGSPSNEHAFVFGFRDVGCHPKIVLLRIPIHRLIQFCGNRVWSVRGHADTQSLRFIVAEVIDFLNEIANRLLDLALGWSEHLLISNALQSEFAHRRPRRSEIHHF